MKEEEEEKGEELRLGEFLRLTVGQGQIRDLDVGGRAPGFSSGSSPSPRTDHHLHDQEED